MCLAGSPTLRFSSLGFMVQAGQDKMETGQGDENGFQDYIFYKVYFFHSLENLLLFMVKLLMMSDLLINIYNS